MPEALSILAGAHDWRLVAVAGVVSFLASLAGVMLFARARTAAGRVRAGLVAAGGGTVGAGMFVTNLIVMLAHGRGSASAFDAGSIGLSFAAAAAMTAAGIVLAIGLKGAIGGRRATGPSDHLDTALNNMSQGLVMFDGSARLVVCNRSYLDMYGLSPEIVRPGCTLRDFLHHRAATGTLSVDPEQYGLDVMAMIANGTVVKDTMEFADGRTVEIVLKPLRGGGWVATHDDITQRRRAEQAAVAARATAEHAEQDARAAHARLLDAFEVVPEALALFDAEDRYVLWNSRYAELYALSRDDMAKGMRFEDVLRAGLARGQYLEAQGREEAWLAERLARHAEPRSTQEQRLPDDRWIRIEERRTSDGGSVGIRVDITDLKRREASFRLLFEGNPVPMWVYDRETLRFLAVNDAAVEHYGYGRERFLAMSLLDIRPAEDRDELVASVKEGLAARDSRVWCHIKADGTRIDVTTYSRRLTYAERGATLVAAIDVTERRQAELALTEARAEAERAQRQAQEAHALLLDAFEVVPEGLVLLDAEDRYLLWNRRFAEVYGETGSWLQVGARFEDALREGLRRGHYPEAAGREETWIAQRLALHREPQSAHEQRLPDDRWIRVEERRTSSGGSVGVRIDITELKRREASFRLLFDSNPIPMWVYDLETLRYLAVNDAAIAHYGYSRDEFLAMTVRDIRPAEDRDALEAYIRARDPGRDPGRVWRHVKADGTQIEVAIYWRTLQYAGRAAGLVAGIDVTERRRAEDELRRTRKFLDTVVENMPATLVVKNARDLRLMLINRAGENLFGKSREDLKGRTAREALPAPIADIFDALDRDALSCPHQVVEHSEQIETLHNGVRQVTSKNIVIRDEHGEAEYLLGLIDDVTERKRAEARIEYLAHYDVLTALPNRAAFIERLGSAFGQTADASFAVLCLDLDRFKEINDVFGHLVGDALLCEASRRLNRAADGAFLARIGGDEFALTAGDGPQPSTGAALADRLQAAFADDIEIDGHKLRVGLSIGVAIFPADGADPMTLVGNANAALDRAKAEGRGTIRFFEADMDEMVRERRALQQDLRSAIASGELSLHYQPQARIDGEIIGFEALLRWQHPGRGTVAPNVFIPLAEDSGLIVPIGEWVMREACREAASWPRPLQIAINLSPAQFGHGDLCGLVHTVLLETGLAPGRVELEITEGVLIGDNARALSILRRLKSLGVRIAMDDFGTGYSSLSYLQSFPFDKIKIDKSFTANLERNPHSAAIVRAVIGLGRGMALPVVAEGVETEEQLAFLNREACDQVQGYLIGRPAPIAQFAELVGRPRPAAQIRAIA